MIISVDVEATSEWPAPVRRALAAWYTEHVWPLDRAPFWGCLTALVFHGEGEVAVACRCEPLVLLKVNVAPPPFDLRGPGVTIVGGR